MALPPQPQPTGAQPKATQQVLTDWMGATKREQQDMKRNDHWRGAASVNDGGVSKNGAGCYKGRPNVYRWTIGYWTFKEHLKNQERERAMRRKDAQVRHGKVDETKF